MDGDHDLLVEIIRLHLMLSEMMSGGRREALSREIGN
jgi:hypothetical protein